MVTLGYIENFLTPVEIEWFVWYWKCLPSKIDTGQRVRSLTHHDQPFFHRIKEKLVEKIEQNNPHEKISTVNRHEHANGILYLKGGDLTEELASFPNAEITPLTQFFTEDFFETKKVVFVPL